MNFSAKLIKLRKSNGLSQEDLANEINVSRQTVSKWELGVTTPDMEKLKQISDYFGVSVDELISEANDNDVKYVNNKEFIGADEKYIPKQSAEEVNLNYVNKNKKSNKIFLIYLIPIIFVVFSMIIMIVVFGKFGRIFDIIVDRTNGMDETFKNTSTQFMELIDKQIESEKEADKVMEEKEKDAEEMQKEFEQKQEEMVNEIKQKVEERQNDMTQQSEDKFNRIKQESENILNQFNEKYNYFNK